MKTPRVIGGPAFEVHLDALLDVSVRLVNDLTGDWIRGDRQLPASDDDRRVVVAGALAGGDRPRPEVDPDQARLLSHTAGLLRRAFELFAHGDLEAAVVVVNDLMDSSGARPELVYRGDGEWAMHFRGNDDTLANGWGAGCATGLAMTIGSDLGRCLGVCEASRCDQVFVDASRNRVRRYCSTACQNRMKSAAFRLRRT